MQVCFTLNQSALRSRQRAETRDVLTAAPSDGLPSPRQGAQALSLAEVLTVRPKSRGAQRSAGLTPTSAFVATDYSPSARPVTPAPAPSVDLMRAMNAARTTTESLFASATTEEDTGPRATVLAL